MMDRRPIRLLLALLLAALPALATPAPAPAQTGLGEYEGAAALGLALRRTGTTARVLMVGAHPDDEDTQLLAALALGRGADVAYLSLTRGEGGQNGLGPELQEALGLLRTEELLAARRVEGAAQRFTRAYDFGFSKSADETFGHWPREALLADVVEAVRAFRPDVVVAVFGGTPADGHGQHQVSAMLAREAFAAAGDPDRFPEQLTRGLRPHRPTKLYRSLRGREEGSTLRVPVGTLDPLVGRSHFQLAMASRSRHRSQDMGVPEPAGPRWGYLVRWAPQPGAGETDLFDGVPATLAARAEAAGAPRDVRRRLEAYGRGVAEMRDRLNPLAPERIAPEAADALRLLRGAEAALPDDGRFADLRFHLAREREDAEVLLARAAGVRADALADDARVVPGQAVEVELSLWNGGAEPVRLLSLAPALPAGWTAEPLDSAPPETVPPGQRAVRRFRVRVPADAEPSQAYFLRRAREGDLYAWPDDPAVRGLPFAPDPLRAAVRVEAAGEEVALDAPATVRVVDPRSGERREPVRIVPAVSVRPEPETVVLPLPAEGAPPPLTLHLRLAAEAPAAGTLRLLLPGGWTAEPASLPLRLEEGDVREAAFTVRAPAGAAAGEHRVRAVFEAEDGRRFARGVETIDYPHVAPRLLLHAAATTVRAFPLRVPEGLRVAYVEGAGEPGPGLLAQIGIVPDLLGAEALAGGDLDAYDVIVVGSRAYEVRPDLRAHNRRLLDWVRRGGTLVVQYNKYPFFEGGFAPYPLTVARPHDRITDETAAVRVLEPGHPVLSAPNPIGPADWEGWVQERGLYFAHTWDDAYTPLLEMADPGEAPARGGLLVAEHGEGTYVYTGLALFRQLPEGVPGAWRLLANLLALGADQP